MFPVAAAARSFLAKGTVSRALFSTKTNIIINAVGRDRTGIVSDVAGTVIEAGGNVGDSQATRLGNFFSLMMLVEVPKDNLADLKKQVKALPNLNAVLYEPSEEEAAVASSPVGYTARFSLEGADNPGIVHKFTSALAKHGLSIDSLETDQELAPYGGTVLFKMEGVVTSSAPPKSFDEAFVKKELKKLGESLNCDVDLESYSDILPEYA